MKKLVTIAVAAAIACGAPVVLAGCGDGWETVSSGGIAVDSVDRDENGYIVEEAAKEAAFTMAEVTEGECTLVDASLDTSGDPVTWTVDFDANGTSYHYVVNAENGDLIDFSSLG
jgi:glycosyltransferase involved in cell wall biosynthesis